LQSVRRIIFSLSPASAGKTKNQEELKQPDLTAQPQKLGWQGLVAVIAFYILLTVVMTWPLILNFGNAVPLGDIEDRYQNFWNFWWVKWALTHFQNPYQTTALYYPYFTGPGPFSLGNSLPLYYHTLQLLNCLLVLPLTIVGGVAAAYNGLVIGSFVASGVGAFLLARHFAKSIPAALLAGTIYAFSGIRFEVMHGSWTNILATQWLPFYILALHLWQERGKYRYLIGAIICLTACVYTDWYNTTYLLLYTLFFFIFAIFLKNPESRVQSPESEILSTQPSTLPKHQWPKATSSSIVNRQFSVWWHQIKRLFPVGLATLVLSTPLVIPSVLELKNPLFITVYGLDKDYRDSTLFSEVANPLSPHGIALWLALLTGIIMLVWQRRRTPWRNLLYWLAFGLLCFVLALGPKLQWERVRGGEPGGPYLPYYLFKKLPAAQVMHSPDRFEIPGTLAFGLAIAYGLTIFTHTGAGDLRFTNKKFASKGRDSSQNGVLELDKHSIQNPKSKIQNLKPSILLAVLLGGLVLAAVNEAPLNMQPLERYGFVDTLLKDKSDYRLLELPITRHNNFDYTRMYSQIWHEHPITGGYISRPILDPYRDPASPFRYFSDQLYLYGNDPNKEIFPASYTTDLTDLVLKLSHFDYVVVYKEDYKKQQEIDQIRALMESHLGKNSAIQEDERTITYKTPPQFWQKPLGPGVMLGDGWYGVEKNEAGLYRWTQQNAELYLTVEKSGPVKLSLTLAAFGGDRDLRLSSEGHEILRDHITPEPKTVEVEFEAKAGVNHLTLESLTRAATPRELNMGDDTRKLAFLVQKITIAESEKKS
jgi:hypothetical protein